MKKMAFKIIFTIFLLLYAPIKTYAVEFNVLVLPTDIFNICDNYFCFPEPSEINANYIIQELNSYKRINTVDLATVRTKLYENSELKQATQFMLKTFEQTEKIDFSVLKELSKEFGVKSILIISSYSITDRSSTRRNLWEILEVSSAFNINYPFSVTTIAVLTDTVNNVVMWSGKYNKTIADSNGYFIAKNQAQAASHLEKIKQYYKNNVSKNISQNVRLRFFPKGIRTIELKKQNVNEEDKPIFKPNALEHLIKQPFVDQMQEESEEELIFTF